METKICKTCRIEKPLSDFYKESSKTNQSSPDPASRVKARCRECSRLRARVKPRPENMGQKLCIRCGKTRSLDLFRRNKLREDGFMDWCIPCSDVETFYSGSSPRREALQQVKLRDIKAQGYLCPGCLENFSSCSDRALLMVFERSHMHGRSCRKVHKIQKTFLSCRVCNSKQGDSCGYWDKTGEFIKLSCDTVPEDWHIKPTPGV